MHVTWPSLEGSADWIMNTELGEPDLVSVQQIPHSQVKAAAKQIPCQSQKLFHPKANKHRAPEAAS